MPKPERNIFIDAVRAELESLGNTPKEIAATLTKNGTTGFREHPDRCPVANHLYKVTGGMFASVDPNAIDFVDMDISVKTPKAASKFIKEFDAGKYLELVALETEF